MRPTIKYFIWVLYFLATYCTRDCTSCYERYFESSSFVCVCNATHCDLPGPPNLQLPDGMVRVVRVSKDKHRNSEEIKVTNHDYPKSGIDVHIDIDYSKKFQTMLGFGGAFTDAAGINIRKLTTNQQDNLLRAYFSNDGAAYNLCRVPIAGSDFSTRPYSYDDVDGDVQLNMFALAQEDYLFKLPYIKMALNISTKGLKLLGSPWSPPAWMKTNGMFNESGVVIPEFWQIWSNYIVKFVKAYEEEIDAELWGLTTQNEPLSGLDPEWSFNCCGWTAEDMRDWITSSLGPTLEAEGMRRLILLVDDYNRGTLPDYVVPMLDDANCSSYIDGVAVHWYDDLFIGPEVLDDTNFLFPDKFILYTEACAGNGAPPGESVILGSFERGESYMKNIIEDINHWSTGWIDWNLVLSMDGGPNWASNYVDAPIIVNPETDEFYLQPTYEALSLFSRNVLPDAKKIFCLATGITKDIFDVTAFQNPDGAIVIVLANFGNSTLEVQIEDQTGKNFYQTVEEKTWMVFSYT